MKPLWPKEVQESIDRTRQMGEELKTLSADLIKKKVMKNEISELCYQTSDKIVNILDGLGYSSERKPSYENELRDLIAIEVRRSINETGIMFYNNVAMVPISKEEVKKANERENDEIQKLFNWQTKPHCCGGFEGACSCSDEKTNDNPTA
jgi:hypothetical protein